LICEKSKATKCISKLASGRKVLARLQLGRQRGTKHGAAAAAAAAAQGHSCRCSYRPCQHCHTDV